MRACYGWAMSRDPDKRVIFYCPFLWGVHSGDGMLPGFSDDGESGEELPGDVMVVTGRGIQPAAAGTGRQDGGAEASSGRSGLAGEQASDNGGMDDLVVSGFKLRGGSGEHQGGRHHDDDGGGGVGGPGFEFPGFAPKQDSTSPMGHSSREGGGLDASVHDIPFDI